MCRTGARVALAARSNSTPLQVSAFPGPSIEPVACAACLLLKRRTAVTLAVRPAFPRQTSLNLPHGHAAGSFRLRNPFVVSCALGAGIFVFVFRSFEP